jgi:sialate O-acetylesterase
MRRSWSSWSLARFVTGSLAFAALAPIGWAQIRLPSVLGDGMVLQRESEVVLWGRAAPGAEIRIAPSWTAESSGATADAKGGWRATVQTPAAGGPFEIRFTGDGERVLRDVWSGEVWLCSGQSNMEWHVADLPAARRGVPGPDEEVAKASFPGIRLFDVPNRLSNHELRDAAGEWRTCSPATAGGFSATAYFFGRALHQELGVPIGLITADWGGTPVRSWISAEALRAFPEVADELEYVLLSVDPNRRHEYARSHGSDWWSLADERGGESDPRWSSSGFDDASWKEIELPSLLGGDLARFDGFVSCRREVELPAEWAGKGATLELGAIDDRDDAWFEGVHVGSTREDGRWSTPRRYAVPASAIHAGRCAIALRVLDTGGPGGFHGESAEMVLRSDDASLAPIPLAGPWRLRAGAALSALPPIGSAAVPKLGAGSPSVLFNGMIAPLLPLRFRGALWYQGEADVGRAELYRRMFPALVADWRARFSNGAFPFHYVQIAPYSYPGQPATAAAELRDAQRRALEDLGDAGMAVTLDLGDPDDIHPGNKQEVGRRLALAALAGTYGRRMLSRSGPLYRGLAIEGSRARVMFDASAPLVLAKGDPRAWQIAGEDRRFFDADAAVDGDTVLVSSPRVPQPVAVRYAFTNAASACLFDAAKLPASSFRTDDWSGELPWPEDSGATSHLSDEPGFEPLFDGRDLEGWVPVNCDESTWRAVDGKIVCSGVPTGVLRTEKSYENFVLELEWRHLAATGNAGLFVWSDPLPVRGEPFPRAIEVQVMTGLSGEWYTSDGDVFPIQGATMTPLTGARPGSSRAYPTEARVRPGGEWNHYRVTCVGGVVELAVNGRVVTRGKDCVPRKGYVCLESEGTPVEFRNLRIRELPGGAPPLAPALASEEARGFRSLYGGVDFKGWKHGPKHEGHWKAEDWTITFDGQGDHLWSEEEFGDFVLIADWRWTAKPHEADLPVVLSTGETPLDENGKPRTQRVLEAGDSGIYLRGNDKSQVNIWCWPIGSGEVYGYRTDGSMPPEVRAGVTPKVAADAPLGEWNRFVITMVGETLTVELNGKLVIDRARLPGVPARGPIALQQHGGAIQFANLYVLELSAPRAER